MRVLFLDFDGVLHSVDAGNIEYEGSRLIVTGDKLFEHAAALADMLDQAGNVKVIIASSWKNHFTDDELLERLGPLARFVAGTTREARQHRPCASRYDECQTIAEVLDATDWRLVDDQPEIVFGNAQATKEMMARAIFCDPLHGIAGQHARDQLARWLKS